MTKAKLDVTSYLPSHLSVTFMSSLVSLTQVELHSVRVFVVQLLHQVQGPLAQCLTNRIKEDKDEIRQITCNQEKKIILIGS